MMVASPPGSWQEQNQRYLVAELAELRKQLESDSNSPDSGIPDEVATLREAMSVPPAIDTLSATFGLSAFERSVLLLCAGVELDSKFTAMCARLQADPSRGQPTLGMALGTLPNAHWSALAPEAPLRRWRLVEIGSGPSLVGSPLRIDEWALHYLVGLRHMDERLACLVEVVAPSALLSNTELELAHRVAGKWMDAEAARTVPVVQLRGDDAEVHRKVAASACVALGLELVLLPARLVPTEPTELKALTRLWQRESALTGCALLVECNDSDTSEVSQGWAVDRFLESVGGAVLVSIRQHRRDLRRPSITLDVPRPSRDEQRDVWSQVLGQRAAVAQIPKLVAHFDLSSTRIEAAAAEALANRLESPTALAEKLWDACRSLARGRLEDLAQRLEPKARWDDLVLPEVQLASLQQIGIQVRHRLQVYESWGFASRSNRGLGITALFAGPSGTGKTMAAEVLAGSLGLDLYRIDLSQVVSKYIGETEKNLRRIFDAADEVGAVLLFDEADALFGKRTEVKDSHDRYANIEISYLLQRMEVYRGLAILTTNARSALDAAFLRRLRFVVQFPFPDTPHRADIWRRVFPPATPTYRLEPERLAHLNLAGGSIANVAMGAAFLAAEADEPVRMPHVAAAARTEFAKLEKPLPELELMELEKVEPWPLQ